MRLSDGELILFLSYQGEEYLNFWKLNDFVEIIWTLMQWAFQHQVAFVFYMHCTCSK